MPTCARKMAPDCLSVSFAFTVGLFRPYNRTLLTLCARKMAPDCLYRIYWGGWLQDPSNQPAPLERFYDPERHTGGRGRRGGGGVE